MSHRGWIVAVLAALTMLTLTVLLAIRERQDRLSSPSGSQAMAAAQTEPAALEGSNSVVAEAASRLPAPGERAPLLTQRAASTPEILPNSDFGDLLLAMDESSVAPLNPGLRSVVMPLITGHVIDLREQPLAGIRVRDLATGLETRTDDSGRFELATVGSDSVDLRFTEMNPPSRVSEREDVTPGGEPMEVVLGWEPARVTGHVLDEPADAPHVSFTLVVDHFEHETNAHRGTEIINVEDSDGQFAFTLPRPGLHRLGVRVGEGDFLIEEFSVTESGQSFEDLEIRVGDPDPGAEPGAVMGIVPASTVGSEATLVEIAGVPEFAEPDANGAFSLGALPPGLHTLLLHSRNASGEERLVGYLPEVPVIPGTTTELGFIAKSELTDPQSVW